MGFLRFSGCYNNNGYKQPFFSMTWNLVFSAIPTMQYNFSGFLTLQQMVDSFILFIVQQPELNSNAEIIKLHLLTQFPNFSIVFFSTKVLLSCQKRISSVFEKQHNNNRTKKPKRFNMVLYPSNNFRHLV